MVGAKNGEITVTVGCVPLKVSCTPPPPIFALASVVQVVITGEVGAIPLKSNVTLCPGFIGSLPVSPVTLMVVADSVKFQPEDGVIIVTGDKTVNPDGMDILADPRVLSPVFEIVTE